MKFSVIIPVLNERSCLPGTIDSVRLGVPGAEIIAVDGGSTDGSREWLLQQRDIRLVDSVRGKGPQQNAGAAGATGDALLFLHADCQVPADAASRLGAVLSGPRVAGGGFFVRFEEQRPRSLRVLAFAMNARLRVLRRCFGDQALFVRREVFERAGGFPDWPLFEDFELVRRVKQFGEFGVIPAPVTLSARRFLKHGVWRTVLLVFLLQIGYYLGISPARLKRWFADIRPHLNAAGRNAVESRART